MPQFDIATFFVEIVWSFMIFCSFYSICLYSYFPKLSKLLKLRKRRFIQTVLFKLIFNIFNINLINNSTKKDVFNLNIKLN